MLRGLTRLILTLVLATSLAGTVLTAAHIASDPLIAPFVDATQDQIIAATNRMLAQSDTPALLHERIDARLAESPRNWMALDALTDLAIERAIDLPPALLESVRIKREDDHGLYSQTISCAACAYDPAECSLTQVMICQAPIALTPIGDIAGVARAGVAYASGTELDQVDLALSVVGLGATAAVLASGGSSYTLKAGASLAKLAYRMGRLSPRLIGLVLETMQVGVRWASLPAARSLDDLAVAIRIEAFAPLTNTISDLSRLTSATNATSALHLLPLVDGAADARRIANAATALGPKLVGRAELLGKARLFRATLKISNTAWTLGASIVAAFLSASTLLAGVIQHALLHRLSKYAKRGS